MNRVRRFRHRKARGGIPAPDWRGLDRDGPRHGARAVVPALVLFCLGTAADGSAQHVETEGWAIGLDVGATVASFEYQPRDTGLSVGFRAGYGLNRILAPYLGVYEVDIDTPQLEAVDGVTRSGHYDFGIRLHLPGGSRRWVPFGDVAVTLWPVSQALEDGERIATDFTGATMSLGGGISMYVSEVLALDVSVKWGKGEFDNVPIGDTTTGGLDILDIDAESARFTVGVSWWP